ncbi:MAG: hypothetical protein ACTSUE_19620, partial [Promethearchaeota archaeon]
IPNRQKYSIVKDPYFALAVYMLTLFHSNEYYHAHVNSITGFFVILGIYFFTSGKEKYGFLAWGIGITFKITLIFLILFFIFKKPFKKFVNNVAMVVISQIPSIAVFLYKPSLIFSFLNSNIVYSSQEEKYFKLASANLARNISNLFGIDFLPLAISFLVGIIGFHFILTWKCSNLDFIDKLMVAFLSTIVAFPDFMTFHNLFFLGLYIIWFSHSNIVPFKTKALLAIPTMVVSFWAVSRVILVSGIQWLYFIPLLLSISYLYPLIMIDLKIIEMIRKNKRRNIEMEKSEGGEENQHS